MARKETGIQFLARLGSRPSLENLEPAVFGAGPNGKDVIELFGEEGTGKSQMVLHLIANCILSEDWNEVKVGGHSAGVIVIDTDYKFPILRLVNIMEKKILSKLDQQNTVDKSELIETYIAECLKRLQVVRCSNSSQLILTLHSLEKQICDNLLISAIFIDTISEFYFEDRANGGNLKSSQEANMRRKTSVLSKLVETHKLTIFAVKSAVYKSKDNTESSDLMKRDFEADHSEFLCRPWQTFVTHRLVFKALDGLNEEEQLFVVGGDCVQGNAQFKVTEMGIQFV